MSPTEHRDLHETITRAVGEAVGPISDRLDKIDRHLTGGDVPSRGIHVRLDRLEQESRRRGKWMGWIASSTIGLIVATAWRFISP